MELLAIIDSPEGVAENLRGFYEKKSDGKFWLKVKTVGTVALEDVGALKQSNSEISAERTQLKDQMKKFEGLDPEIAHKAIAKLEEMKGWKPDDKIREQIADQVNQVKDAASREKKILETKLQETQGHLENMLLNNAADGGFFKHQFVEGGPDVLRPHVLARLGIFEENGKPIARVKTATGTVQFSLKSGSGSTPMDVQELLDTMKAQKPFSHLFAGSGASGTGAKGSGDSGGGDNKDLAGLKSSDRLVQIRRRQAPPTNVNSGQPIQR